jgi:hypothetical protein
MPELAAPDLSGFWRDKQPCWELRGCAAEACRCCVAYRDQSRPCWDHEGTLCKQMGINTCFTCEVSRRYGGNLRPPGDERRSSP